MYYLFSFRLGERLQTIPKKKIGHRTVATMASGCRGYTSLGSEEESQWNIDASQENDSPKPNAYCLMAAEERLIDQGLIRERGFDVLVILWGFV